MPWDTRYEEEIGGARKRYLDTVNNLDSAQVGVEQDYGLSPAHNDYQSNPYSRAALLESEYQRANRGTLNSAGYQLYSGAAGNHLAANRSSYDINRDQLEKAYNAALAEGTAKRTEAKEREAEEEREAAFGRNERAEKAPLDSSQAPPAKKKQKQQNKGGGNKGGNGGPAVGSGHPAQGSKKGKRR